MGAQTQVKYPRIVLDTNVVVSTLIFKSSALAWLRFAWQARRFTPLICTESARELVAVLAYPKFELAQRDREALLGDYLPFCEIVRPVTQLPATLQCRDPNNALFLRMAAGGKADVLVSGDKNLLALKSAAPFAILTPRQFRDMVG